MTNLGAERNMSKQNTLVFKKNRTPLRCMYVSVEAHSKIMQWSRNNGRVAKRITEQLWNEHIKQHQQPTG